MGRHDAPEASILDEIKRRLGVDPEQSEPECDDAPKLTADEWAYIAAVTEGGS